MSSPLHFLLAFYCFTAAGSSQPLGAPGPNANAIPGGTVSTTQPVRPAPGQPVLPGPPGAPPMMPTGPFLPSIPLAPYAKKLAITLPESFVLLRQGFRYIGAQVVPVSSNVISAVQASLASYITAGDAASLQTDILSIANSQPAKVIIKGSIAPVPRNAGMNRRKLLIEGVAPTPAPTPAPMGATSNFSDYASIDVDLQITGNPNSSFLPVNLDLLLGYMDVTMQQHGFQVEVVSLNSTFSSVFGPIMRSLPLGTLYILESVLQVEMPGLRDMSLEFQNFILVEMNRILSSQQSFAFNLLLDGWVDPASNEGRVVLKTFVNQQFSSLDAVIGDSFQQKLQQKADAAGIPANLTILQSQYMGTTIDAMNSKFVDLTAVPATTAALAPSPSPLALPPIPQPLVRPASSSDAGLVAGIVVPILALLALAGGAAAYLTWRKQKQRQDVGSVIPSKDEFFVACSSTGPAGVSTVKEPGNSLADGFEFWTSSDSDNMATKELLEIKDHVSNISPEELQIYRFPDGKEWVLGRGSFGEVVRGRRSGVQDVAIKRLLEQDVLHLRLFEKEIAMLKMLNHDRNIVQFYGCCVAGGCLMLVQEYMEGGDLREALGRDEEGLLGWYAGGARLLLDVARGLHFLHVNKVVHRDLKTKNILLTADNKIAKIGDIGIAKLVDTQLLSSYVNAAGTFAYAAPELLMGTTCDVKADIFSFGTVLWEVVAHEVPIRARLRRLKVPEECPVEVAKMVDACLQSDPKLRPSAKEICLMLSQLLSGDSKMERHTFSELLPEDPS